jgi:hypothetical protein
MEKAGRARNIGKRLATWLACPAQFLLSERRGEAMAFLRNSAGDPARHQQVIEALAKENSATVDHVRELFESEHKRLESEARVKTFVSVIATRLVREVLIAERASS